MPRKNNTGVAGALRLAQTQPVTFSEGLIRTDDNSVLGYVSDLYNTEIDRNGNIRRRKGSVVMNSGKLNEKWYFKESYQIAGVTVLFGLSYKRELWAWIGAWPETDFKVCEKNIYSRFPHYSSGSNRPDYNPWVSFSRGSSFHVLKTDRHMTIVNNLNDAVRIYNRGCFAIAKYNEDVTKTFMKEDIDASRNETDIDLALYVSVKDVTNRIMEPAIVVKSDDRYPLVEGTVQFAAMNEENVPGKFTDPQKIETGSPYFSIFDAKYIDDTGVRFDKKSELFASDGIQHTDFAIIRKSVSDEYEIIKNADWTPDTEGETLTKEYITATIIVDEFVPQKTKTAQIIWPGSEIEGVGIANPGVFFRVIDIWTNHPNESESAGPVGRMLGGRIMQLTTGSGPARSINADDYSGTWTAATDLYTYNIAASFNDKAIYNTIKLEDGDPLKGIRCSNVKFVWADGQREIYDEHRAAVLFARIEVLSATTYLKYLDEIALEYDTSFFNNSTIMFEDIGFNLWNIFGRDIDLQLSNLSNVDYNSKAIFDLTDGERVVVVDNTDNQADEFLKNGHRWCVKSGDKIVAKSQMGFLNKNSDNILYQLDAVSSLEENHNKLPFQLKPAYLPVISLHGSSILSYPDPDKNTDVFYDVQYAFNVDDVLIVIQDGAIWTGNTNTLKLTYDKAIQGAVLSADRFYNGVLIGTTDGIYFYNNGKLEHCVDGQKITAITIASGTNGAVVVDDNGRLHYAYIMLMESGFYAKVTDIHRNVSDIDFSSAIVKYVNGVFYFAMEDQVIGLYIERSEEGTIRRFDRINNFEGQKIDGITEYEGQPVLWFGTGAVKSEVFEQPYDGGEN